MYKLIDKFLASILPPAIYIEYFSPEEKPQSPREIFGTVFDLIQLSHTYADSKTFVDMQPKRGPRRILKAYGKQYGAQLDIKRFVRDHFAPPPALPEPKEVAEGENKALEIRQYIDMMWDVLRREPDRTHSNSSLLPLPHSYVVPGGRFREIYYWDSYFTMLGLRESARHDLIEDMVKNFAYLIERYGFVPNGNRSYYLSRSQPPVFSQMVELLAQLKGEEVYEKYRPFITKEYKFWMRGKDKPNVVKKRTNAAEHVVVMPDGEILNRYWDSSIAPREESFREDVEIGRVHEESANFYRNMRAGAESGWDYSIRWFEPGGGRESIRTTDIVPIDLNILLLQMEETLSKLYQREAKYTLCAKYERLANERREALHKYLWDEEAGWFGDYVLSEEKTNAENPTLAGMFALYAGVATTEQAGRMIERLERDFMRPGGVVNSLITSGEQWDAPNCWAPLVYVTVMGLERYGAHELAREIATRWCSLNIYVYEKTGLLLEKYNVEDIDTLATGGEYTLQDGFGWTNGVLLTLMNKYHINQELPVDEGEMNS